jgi:toxin HigB-1
MIQSFKDKALEGLFLENSTRGIPSALEKKIRIRLEVLDSASVLEDIALPGYKLHPLKGDRKGTWSIRVSGNWRITFTFKSGEISDVDLEDYH